MRRSGGPRAASLLRLSVLCVLVAGSGLYGLRADARPGQTTPSAASVELPTASVRSLARQHGAVPFKADGAPRRTAGVRTAAVVPHLSYYAGPVVATATIHPVLYGAGAYVPQVLPAAAPPNVSTFLTNFLASTAYSWLGEYDTNIASQAQPAGTPGTNQHIVPGAAVPAVTISPTTVTPTITDTDIQQQLTLAIGNGSLPAPTKDGLGHASSIYPVFTPAGTTVCLDLNTCSLRSGGFCAYHGAFDLNGTPVLYTVQPDFAAVAASGNCGPGNAFQVTSAVLSHELVETVTDPLGPIADPLVPPLGWYDYVTTGLGEITDICEDTTGTFTGADGRAYTVQGQWSNASRACIVDKIQAPLTPPAPGPGPGSALDTTSPVTRLLDTRSGAPVGAGRQVTIHTTAAGASAVILNVTATGATASTYVSVWPCDQARPSVSSLNAFVGDTVANLVTVQVAANGDVCAFNNAGFTHLVVDQMASYKVVENPVATGRLVTQTPVRALDTRTKNAPFHANEERVVDLKAVGVPDNALAVVITMTAPDSVGPGYWAVWPSGPWPGTSSLNLSARNQTRANQSVVPLDAGTIKLRSQIGGHVVVDVAGWFTGTGGVAATSGLFHPLTPERRADTRVQNLRVTNALLDLNGVVGPDALAVIANVTAVGASGSGFVTVYPPADPVPNTSNLNFTTGAIVPGHVTVALSGGQMGFHSNVATYLVVDLFGWYS